MVIVSPPNFSQDSPIGSRAQYGIKIKPLPLAPIGCVPPCNQLVLVLYSFPNLISYRQCTAQPFTRLSPLHTFHYNPTTRPPTAPRSNGSFLTISTSVLQTAFPQLRYFVYLFLLGFHWSHVVARSSSFFSYKQNHITWLSSSLFFSYKLFTNPLF